jgi:plastocyanin
MIAARRAPAGRSATRRFAPRSLALDLVTIAAVALAGCSGAAAASGSPVATTSVELPKSYKFVPAAIVVDVGATVTWTNHDDFTHNITFPGEAPLTMKPGESVTRPFPTAGTFAYQCSLHPRDMNGVVTVGG